MEQRYKKIKHKCDLSEYQIKKYKAFFKVLDVTDDDYVDFIDFILGAQRVKTHYNWADTEPLYLDLLAAKANFWVMLQCVERTVLENKVNEEQMVHFFGKMADAISKGKTVNFGVREIQIKKNVPPGWITSIIITIFKNIDFDESNQISKEEYKVYLEAIDVPITDQKLDEIWDVMTEDVSSDTISIDVMEELLMQWLLNTNEDMPTAGDYFPCGGYLVQWQ